MGWLRHKKPKPVMPEEAVHFEHTSGRDSVTDVVRDHTLPEGPRPTTTERPRGYRARSIGEIK